MSRRFPRGRSRPRYAEKAIGQRCKWTVRHPAFLTLLALAGAFAFATTAFARLGGGESFHGRSNDGGGGGGGGGGDLLFYLLFRLILAYPAVGVPVAIIAVVVFVYISKQQQQTYSPAPAGPASPLLGQSVDAAVDELRQLDPNFSMILFEDFVYTLFGKVHEARGKGKLKDFAPYLGADVRKQLADLDGQQGRLTDVTRVIIGSAKVTRIRGFDGPEISITVGFEANYTETRERPNGGKPLTTALYVEELWEFVRSADVKSRPPEKITVLDCPNCGSSLELTPEGACAHCGVRVEKGDFHWFVQRFKSFGREAQGPLLTQDVPEQGNQLPTVLDRRLAPMQEKFQENHPDFDWPRTQERFQEIFVLLQQAWSTQNWEKARPFVSDSLFQYFSYWIDAYRRQRLKNKLGDVTIEQIVLAKIRMDKYYDAMIVRIFASMTDVLTNDAGKIIRGNPKQPRPFTEYWTFIRRRGAKESHGEMMNCPNCGATLKVNMAGSCEFCGSKLTSGDFDWVLSRIEQDEAYHG